MAIAIYAFYSNFVINFEAIFFNGVIMSLATELTQFPSPSTGLYRLTSVVKTMHWAIASSVGGGGGGGGGGVGGIIIYDIN